jgi:hypothetical protein
VSGIGSAEANPIPARQHTAVARKREDLGSDIAAFMEGLRLAGQ